MMMKHPRSPPLSRLAQLPKLVCLSLHPIPLMPPYLTQYTFHSCGLRAARQLARFDLGRFLQACLVWAGSTRRPAPGTQDPKYTSRLERCHRPSY